MANKQIKKIALERIRILFRQAEEVYLDNFILAQRYVDLALKIAMRTRTHLPLGFRRRVCRHCKCFLMPGYTSRNRIKQKREPHVTITCLKCKFITRIPLRK